VFTYSVSAQKPDKSIDAMNFGAKADGQTDGTRAIQKALNTTAEKGGICFLPEGVYRLNAELVVPERVTLEGVSEASPHPLTPTGTILNIFGGKSDVNAPPAITLKWNASVRKLTVTSNYKSIIKKL
jgi:polygalacturonase